MPTEAEIVDDLFAYVKISQPFFDFCVNAGPNKSGTAPEDKGPVTVLYQDEKVVRELQRIYLQDILSDARLKQFVNPPKIKSIVDSTITVFRGCPQPIFFSHTVFVMVIPLQKDGDIQVRAIESDKQSERAGQRKATQISDTVEESIQIEWRMSSIVIVPRKCRLLVTGLGYLVAHVILFKESQVDEKKT